MRNIIPFLCLLAFGCHNKDMSPNQLSLNEKDSIVLRLQVLQTTVMSEVPSASGVAVLNKAYWLIGDDSPYLFQLDKQLQFIDKTAIYSADNLVNGRIGHSVKPDFEAIEPMGDEQFLIMASGSYSPQRDLCVLIDFNHDTIARTYNLSSFYAYLKADSLLMGHELNMEGLAIAKDDLFLFNRGQNLIFRLNKNDFFSFLEGDSELPDYKVLKFELPKLDSLQAGFSGATYSEQWEKLIFTASYESSPNAYDDGSILGSLVGVIDLSSDELDSEYDYIPIPNTNTPLKIESVAIDSIISENKIQLIFVSDSDGGDSHFVKCLLTLEKILF